MRHTITNRHFHGAYILLGFTLFFLAGCSAKKIKIGTPTGASLGSNVAHTASTQIGKRYRSGGISPQSGFDCSGLVFWAYQQHGIQVPRVTTGQVKAGTAISRSRLLPGDILVFREPSAPNKLHTGIYTGNDNFVHSPASGSSVRIDNLNATHWRNAFISGRRIQFTPN